MKLATLDEYHKMMDDHPRKLDEDQVEYRRSTEHEKCCHCIHFFERRLDDYGVCELMLPDNGDVKTVFRMLVLDG